MIRHRFSAEDFHRMAEAGILSEDDRVELIRGEVVELSPVGKRHMAALKRLLNALFPLQQAKKVLIQVQDPLRLFPDTEPQPDLVLLSYREDFYRERVPEAKDALLVVEVAETSLDHDLKVKLPLYAQAGIPEVLGWWTWCGTGCTSSASPKGQGTRRPRPSRRGSLRSWA
jgi:Uma2 family endonuclease